MVKKAALVTGASQGIGERLASYLAGAGYGVSLVSRGDDGRLGKVADRLAGEGLEVAALPTDLRDETALRDAVRAHEERFGRLDVLVHAAGVLAVGPVAGLRTEALDDVLGVNLRAGILLIREALPLLRAAGGTPLALLLGSTAGLHGSANLAGYAASKFGVVGLAESLSAELAPDGIRVCALCPDRVASTPDLHDDPNLIGLADLEQAVATLLSLSPAVSVPLLPLRLRLPN
jgi:NAD(P)-dependent dehydrogenase (short-subunit alcohol dehydrogenase family)